jgi:hypothetical protein
MLELFHGPVSSMVLALLANPSCVAHGEQAAKSHGMPIVDVPGSKTLLGLVSSQYMPLHRINRHPAPALHEESVYVTVHLRQ